MNRYKAMDDNDNRRKGFWISILFHILLFFLFIVPCFTGRSLPPDDQLQGIVVALGQPEAPVNVVKAKTPSAKKSNPVSNPKPERTAPPKATAVPVKSKTVEERSIVKADDSQMKRKADLELERKRAEEMEAEAKRKAEEKARQKAEELEQKRVEAKSKFSSLLSQKGDSKESASKGQADGRPHASALDNLSRGEGQVGAGLGSRGLLYAPEIRDNTQKTGRVIVTICVNSAGKVINSRYRQKGSTTTDAHLIQLAESSALKYKFSESQAQEQCGDIIIDFKLR